MSTTKSILIIAVLFILCSQSVGGLANDVPYSLRLNAQPQSDYLCGALTENDVKNSEFGFGFDLKGSRAEYEHVLELSPYIALGMLLFAPVEGWLQSHAARGSAIGSFSFDANALDLHALLAPLLDSYDEQRGFPLDAFENLWSELDRSVYEANASFSEDKAVRVDFNVDDKITKAGLPRVRIDVVTEVFDSESRTVDVKEGTRRTYYLSLEPSQLERFPVKSAFAVTASARLHRFELDALDSI